MSESNINFHIINNTLIIPLPSHFSVYSSNEFQKDILSQIKEYSVRKILLDVSAINVMDRKTFSTLVETEKMIGLLGGQTVFTGFLPGVASTLVDLEVNFDFLNIASDVEEGILMLDDILLSSENDKDI